VPETPDIIAVIKTRTTPNILGCALVLLCSIKMYHSILQLFSALENE